MQDRFNFRFWDKKNNLMIYPSEQLSDEEYTKLEKIYLKDEWYITPEITLTDSLNYFDNRPFEIMQCTGLKDKNGKLIYEGDILDLYVSSKKLYRYQVKYEIGSFMLVSQDEIFDFKNVWNDNVYPLSQLYFEYQNEENCIDQCEVVGNIYENPELLENE